MRFDVPANAKLREVVDTDHEWLVDLHNDPDVLMNLTDPRPITLESHLAWWESVRASQKDKRLIFEIDGTPIGFSKFYAIDRINQNCTLGADVHREHRGRGHAKLMWALMLDVCFSELGMHRVALSTAEYNLIAQRLYLGLGFKIEGTMRECVFRNDRFYDGICMYMLRKDWLG